MGWATIERAEFIDGSDRRFVVTDPEQLKRLQAFGRRGSYRCMLKSGYGWEAELTSGGHTWRVYLHGGCFGDRPGGFSQTIFVPAEPGLDAWFERLIAYTPPKDDA
jgi:hypothetical protein